MDPCVERLDGYSNGYRSWLVPWADRYGDWAPTRNISRYTDGMSIADQLGPDSQMVCVNLKYAGRGVGEDGPDLCVVTATYSTRWGDLTDPLEEGSISGEVLTMRGGGVWEDDESPCDDTINKVIAMRSFTVPMKFPYRSDRVRKFGLHIGKVNAYLWRGYEPETIRFEGIRDRTIWENNMLLLDVVFSFTFNPEGWNYRWRDRPAADGSHKIRRIPLIHELTNFDLMFAGAI
jgi:hypothetical protein